MIIKHIIEKLLNYKNLSMLIFSLLIYTAFFGAKFPFSYEAGPKDGTSSNPLNQIFYMTMFILAIAVTIIKSRQIISFTLKEKYLSLFIFYCLLSALWADFPSVSFRRSFQLFVTFYTTVISLLFIDKNRLEGTIRKILIFYIALTVFAIFFIPDAIDPSFNSPRGLTLQKNQFGQISNLLLLIFLYLKRNDYENKYTLIDISGIIISVIFIITSKSTTALVSMLYIFSLQSIFYTDKLFENLRIGRIVSTLLISFIVFIAIYLSFNSDIILKIVQDYLGKDLTFTGRTDHWKMMLLEIQRHPFFGVGYSSFWDVPGSEFRIALIGNSAHNGYLEILNELGIFGMILMIIAITSFFYRTVKISAPLNLITLISILILSFSESSLFREKGATTFVTIWIMLLSSHEYLIKRNLLTK